MTIAHTGAQTNLAVERTHERTCVKDALHVYSQPKILFDQNFFCNIKISKFRNFKLKKNELIDLHF